MDHKTFELLEVKTDGEAGEFSALASVFGNVDRVGDRMLKGAFENTLNEWRSRGKALPIIWSHDHHNPMSYIGKADPRAVMETDEGLLVQGRLDIDDGNPIADQVYKLMKDALVTGMSFAYRVRKGGEKKAKDGANEVSDVDLYEVGPTFQGANALAQVQAVKSMLELPEEPLQWDVERREKFIADARIYYKLPPELAKSGRYIERPPDAPDWDETSAKAVESPTEDVEDREDEDRKASPERQDPLADEIARIEEALILGELP